MNGSQNVVCADECPVRRTAEIIEGKWTTLVIRELLGGAKRYAELQRALAGISPKILSARLRLLERARLVQRTAFQTVPVTTEYRLTPLGERMSEVIRAMAEFGRYVATHENGNDR
jgi:DNA-binding HxlR family transcriptional regulator